MTGTDKSVFNTVTRTLKKITFGTAPGRVITEDCLVMMNVPSLMAQRDSAYEWAAYLIKYLLNVPLEKKVELYDAILELLDSSIDSCDSIILTENVPGRESLDFINKYLIMLRDVVKAASATVSYETSFIEDQLKRDNINAISEPEIRLIGENFRNCELGIYKSILTQVEIAEPYIRKHRESHIRTLSKDSRIRYDKSFKEFEKNYKEYGKSLSLSK
ncbi:MAG: hypothetical protein NT118_07565 [Lentisphaerae bacterium]|nr:hypothetical protein [Lentisphaerota bacterium]